MASSCPGKFAWPELLGTRGSEAIKIIERQNPRVTANLVREGSMVTGDFRCDRVRVWINDRGTITRVPATG